MVNHHMDVAETVQVKVRGKLVRDNSCSGSTNCCTRPATKVSLVLLGTLKCYRSSSASFEHAEDPCASTDLPADVLTLLAKHLSLVTQFNFAV